MKIVLSKEEQNIIVTQFRNSGNLKAFAQLYEFHFNFVYSIAWHYLRDRDKAFDVTQDTFIQVSKKIKQLENVKHFKSWISTISRNLSISQLRKRKSNRNITLEEYSIYMISDVDNSILEERITKLNLVIETLGTAERELINRKYYLRKKISEIARELEISESAVKMRLQRVKDKIKKAS